MTIYGYARVSTREQDLGAQVDALFALGCAKVYQEKRSGAHAANRDELNKAIRRLESGDTLVVLPFGSAGQVGPRSLAFACRDRRARRGLPFVA
jgi:hypothetical protein